ncbi:MAG: hypothetical protein ACTSVY_08150 [Candidatus Helarchaeota archaeon]
MTRSEKIEKNHFDEDEIEEQVIDVEKLEFLRKHFDLERTHPLKLLKKLKELKKLHDEEYSDEIWIIGFEQPENFYPN